MSDTPVNPPVVTRFAPSPTGYLHIGGARTALFNWLFARANNGSFLMRIEDTDRARSTPEATAAIFQSMDWLGLDWDGEAISQFERRDRHAEVAKAMLDTGSAYKCYSTPEEIVTARDLACEAGSPTLFQSPWRDADPASAPDAPFVVRLRAPQEGGLTLKDKVQGKVSWKMDSFDDLVLLRSDGTPTYMLAVVVDDYDMGVTHVIRGDDHLINAGRQTLIYRAMGWNVPEFAHIPLIHGDDGKKLSKRHGALGVEEYRDMGYLAEAMRNYLARLGWSHGNDELFSTEQAIEWFDLKGIGKSPARFDFKKLDNVSAYHMKNADNDDLVTKVTQFRAVLGQPAFSDQQQADFAKAMPVLKDRSKKLSDLIEKAHFVLSTRPFTPDEDASKLLDTVSRSILKRLTLPLQTATWTSNELQNVLRDFADAQELKLGQIAQPLRAALTGRTVSPSVFEMMDVIGRDETLARLGDLSK